MFRQFTNHCLKTCEINVKKVLQKTTQNQMRQSLHVLFFTFCESFCAFCDKCTAGFTLMVTHTQCGIALCRWSQRMHMVGGTMLHQRLQCMHIVCSVHAHCVFAMPDFTSVPSFTVHAHCVFSACTLCVRNAWLHLRSVFYIWSPSNPLILTCNFLFVTEYECVDTLVIKCKCRW